MMQQDKKGIIAVTSSEEGYEDPDFLLKLHDFSMAQNESIAMWGKMMKVIIPALNIIVKEQFHKMKVTPDNVFPLSVACAEVSKNVLVNLLSNFLSAEGTVTIMEFLLKRMVEVFEADKERIFQKLKEEEELRENK